jgi:hypothetical protein
VGSLGRELNLHEDLFLVLRPNLQESFRIMNDSPLSLLTSISEHLLGSLWTPEDQARLAMR